MSDEGAGHLALVGLSGVGKSTLAPLIARRLGGLDVIDVDRVVEASLGTTVQRIFSELGEERFRDAETDALADALSGPPAVIATGGGVVLRAQNRRMLGRAVVVWLRAAPSQLAERLAGTTEDRPLLGEQPAVVLARLAEERDPFYAEVADLTLEVGAERPEDLADQVAGALS